MGTTKKRLLSEVSDETAFLAGIDDLVQEATLSAKL
jgi:hypothetical protein